MNSLVFIACTYFADIAFKLFVFNGTSSLKVLS
jgi:hypothetical protein